MPFYKIIGTKWDANQKIVQTVGDTATMRSVASTLAKKLSLETFKGCRIFACDGTTPIREIDLDVPVKDQQLASMSYLFVTEDGALVPTTVVSTVPIFSGGGNDGDDGAATATPAASTRATASSSSSSIVAGPTASQQQQQQQSVANHNTNNNNNDDNGVSPASSSKPTTTTTTTPTTTSSAPLASTQEKQERTTTKEPDAALAADEQQPAVASSSPPPLALLPPITPAVSPLPKNPATAAAACSSFNQPEQYHHQQQQQSRLSAVANNIQQTNRDASSASRSDSASAASGNQPAMSISGRYGFAWELLAKRQNIKHDHISSRTYHRQQQQQQQAAASAAIGPDADISFTSDSDVEGTQQAQHQEINSSFSRGLALARSRLGALPYRSPPRHLSPHHQHYYHSPSAVEQIDQIAVAAELAAAMKLRKDEETAQMMIMMAAANGVRFSNTNNNNSNIPILRGQDLGGDGSSSMTRPIGDGLISQIAQKTPYESSKENGRSEQQQQQSKIQGSDAVEAAARRRDDDERLRDEARQKELLDAAAALERQKKDLEDIIKKQQENITAREQEAEKEKERRRRQQELLERQQIQQQETEKQNNLVLQKRQQAAEHAEVAQQQLATKEDLYQLQSRIDQLLKVQEVLAQKIQERPDAALSSVSVSPAVPILAASPAMMSKNQIQRERDQQLYDVSQQQQQQQQQQKLSLLQQQRNARKQQQQQGDLEYENSGPNHHQQQQHQQQQQQRSQSKQVANADPTDEVSRLLGDDRQRQIENEGRTTTTQTAGEGEENFDSHFQNIMGSMPTPIRQEPLALFGVPPPDRPRPPAPVPTTTTAPATTATSTALGKKSAAGARSSSPSSLTPLQHQLEVGAASTTATTGVKPPSATAASGGNLGKNSTSYSSNNNNNNNINRMPRAATRGGSRTSSRSSSVSTADGGGGNNSKFLIRQKKTDSQQYRQKPTTTTTSSNNNNNKLSSSSVTSVQSYSSAPLRKGARPEDYQPPAELFGADGEALAVGGDGGGQHSQDPYGSDHNNGNERYNQRRPVQQQQQPITMQESMELLSEGAHKFLVNDRRAIRDWIAKVSNKQLQQKLIAASHPQNDPRSAVAAAAASLVQQQIGKTTNVADTIVPDVAITLVANSPQFIRSIIVPLVIDQISAAIDRRGNVVGPDGNKQKFSQLLSAVAGLGRLASDCYPLLRTWAKLGADNADKALLALALRATGGMLAVTDAVATLKSEGATAAARNIAAYSLGLLAVDGTAAPAYRRTRVFVFDSPILEEAAVAAARAGAKGVLSLVQLEKPAPANQGTSALDQRTAHHKLPRYARTCILVSRQAALRRALEFLSSPQSLPDLNGGHGGGRGAGGDDEDDEHDFVDGANWMIPPIAPKNLIEQHVETAKQLAEPLRMTELGLPSWLDNHGNILAGLPVALTDAGAAFDGNYEQLVQDAQSRQVDPQLLPLRDVGLHLVSLLETDDTDASGSVQELVLLALPKLPREARALILEPLLRTLPALLHMHGDTHPRVIAAAATALGDCVSVVGAAAHPTLCEDAQAVLCNLISPSSDVVIATAACEALATMASSVSDDSPATKIFWAWEKHRLLTADSVAAALVALRAADTMAQHILYCVAAVANHGGERGLLHRCTALVDAAADHLSYELCSPSVAANFVEAFLGALRMLPTETAFLIACVRGLARIGISPGAVPCGRLDEAVTVAKTSAPPLPYWEELETVIDSDLFAPPVKIAITESLVKEGGAAGEVKVTRIMLRHAYPWLRAACARALRHSQGTPIVSLLLAANDTDPSVREAALETIEGMSQERVAEALATVQRERVKAVAQCCRDFLQFGSAETIALTLQICESIIEMEPRM